MPPRAPRVRAARPSQVQHKLTPQIDIGFLIMSRSTLIGAIACALTVVSMDAAAAGAGQLFGTWKRPTTGVIVSVFRCGGGLGVKVLKSAVRKRIGKVYMCGAKRGSNGTYWGKLRNPEDNLLYSGGARLISTRQLKLSGCIPGTALCRSEVWHRVK